MLSNEIIYCESKIFGLAPIEQDKIFVIFNDSLTLTIGKTFWMAIYNRYNLYD